MGLPPGGALSPVEVIAHMGRKRPGIAVHAGDSAHVAIPPGMVVELGMDRGINPRERGLDL